MHTFTPQDFASWQSDLTQVCGRFDARRSTAAAHFYGKAERRNFGDLEIATIGSNAASIARGRRRSNDSDQFCFLVLQLDGQQHLAVDRLEPIAMGPGDVMLLDSATSFEMLPHGYVENLSVHLPRPLVKSQLPGRVLTGKLAERAASTRLLREMMRQAAVSVGEHRATRPEGVGLRDALLSLLACAVREPDDEQAASTLHETAARLIDTHLASFDLTPDWLADRLQTSRRSLYRAFAAEGHPGVTQFILERRLDRAAAELRRTATIRSPLASIAVDVGIVDSAHFSRAFRRRFSMTPSQFRASLACDEIAMACQVGAESIAVSHLDKRA